jgi:hypothetical protein
VFFAGLVVGLPGAVAGVADQLQTGRLGAGDLAVFVGGLLVSSALVLLVDPARWGRSIGGGVSGGGLLRGRALALSCALAVILGSGTVQAQFEVRAAATEPTDGWVRMERGGAAGQIWVASNSSLTAADIARAQENRDTDGRLAVSLELADEGAVKMRALSSARIGQPLAMVVDGELLWAPTVRTEIGREVMITGGGPNGLTRAEVEQIVGSVSEGPAR